MTNTQYKLNVVSQHTNFKDRTLRQHMVDGLPHVGVWGDEPFALQFRNTSSEPVQVRLSLDGTDILTTQPASISPTGKMWLVEAYQTLTLEAWPETNESGARFVFRSEDNAVALHTHGNMSQKGIIAAAVYTDAARPVYRTRGSFPYTDLNGVYGSTSASNTRFDSMDLTRSRSLSKSVETSLNIGETFKSAAVGAGETIKQAIGSAKGLVEPRLAQVITLKYLWWDELTETLAAQRRAQDARPTGFVDYQPTITKMADLGSTPRTNTSPIPPQQPKASDYLFERVQ